MAISLVFLSLSQTSLLLLVGPLLKSLFELGSTDRLISLSSLLPEGVSSYIPGIEGGADGTAVALTAADLSFAMPLLI
jgi:hypothetical protein